MTRNDRDRAPITIDARSASARGAASSRIRSTSTRLARCGDAADTSSGTSPPRYTTRARPARCAAAANVSAAIRSRSPKPSLRDEGSIEWIR